MDFGGELFWVVMLIFYIVFQVLGARKKKQEHQKRRPRGPQEEPASRELDRSTELDEALGEIRRALGYPEERREEPVDLPGRPVEKPLGELSARDEPSRMPPPRRKPLEGRSLRNEPSRIPPPARRDAPKPRPVGRRTAMPGGSIYTADEKAAIGHQDAFEKLDATQPSLPSLPSRKSPLPAVTLSDDETTAASRLPDIVKRLQTPSSAREAVLIKEIFDPPRALRRLR